MQLFNNKQPALFFHRFFFTFSAVLFSPSSLARIVLCLYPKPVTSGLCLSSHTLETWEGGEGLVVSALLY